MIRQMPAGHNDTGDVLCCIQKETGASKNDKARLGWNMAASDGIWQYFYASHKNTAPG